mgnify:FL=1
MRLTEVKKDLFSVDPQYSLAHCISADFALGAGIAKQFDTRFNMRYELFEKYGSYHFTGGRCLKIGSVFNLVTKDKCWQKPTYKALREALEDMKKQVVTLKIKYLAMPLIGCGLDKLEWDRVRELLEKVFADTDVDIMVCYR